MKNYLCIAALFALAACGKPAQPKVEDVAANQMVNDDVTEVADDSATANGSENAVDPD